MPGSARMIDVAKLAGVSTMTVSRVLNEGPNVTEATRQRVFAAIEQLRYQPNELARSLRDRRSRQIGVLLPYLYDPFFASCAHVISSVARSHSYSVVIATTNEDPQLEFEEASRMLRRNVEGLIIIPSHPSRAASPLLAHEFERLPIVTLDRPVDGSRFDSILVENERGAHMATEHLLKLGHKRIAYIGLTDDLYTMRMRYQGYCSAMNKAGLTPAQHISSGELSDSLALVAKMMKGSKPPQALFCANNLISRHVLHGLQAIGMHPPESVALVGFDDFETADLMRPGITVVSQPTDSLARQAVDVLFDHLSGGRQVRGGKHIILPVELTVRGSCGAEPAA